MVCYHVDYAETNIQNIRHTRGYKELIGVACKENTMQNGAYDTGVLWYNNHILIEKIKMDTLIAAHVCWPELPRDLGFLGS